MRERENGRGREGESERGGERERDRGKSPTGALCIGIVFSPRCVRPRKVLRKAA